MRYTGHKPWIEKKRLGHASKLGMRENDETGCICSRDKAWSMRREDLKPDPIGYKRLQYQPEVRHVLMTKFLTSCRF